jgi:CRISPR system Cascade subunit CasC
VAEKPAGRGRGRAKPAEDGPKAPDGFAKAVEALLDGGKAADLALFGRMLADLPEKNIDAACQVAHAITTNPIHSIEFDYYTAVDDLKPTDTAGADMIGTVEFNSACFYRYANLDLGQLTENLKGDAELARKTAEAFLRASVEAVPTGKQNGFAAHNKPALVFAVARSGPPVSLANAFVKPIRPPFKHDLESDSVLALDRFYRKLTAGYGDGGFKAAGVFNMTDAELDALKPFAKGGVDEVFEAVLAPAFQGGAA